MKIVANIMLGNEVELIEQHIQYHLSLGIDAFVIVDMFSWDGTAQKLQPYKSDPRFRIREVTPEEVIVESGLRTNELSAWMLEIARTEFQADWVIRLDADEFIFPRNGDLAASLAGLEQHPVLQIQRYNVAFPSGTPLVAPPTTWQALSEYSIVAKPFPANRDDYAADQNPPLDLTRVIPKTEGQNPPLNMTFIAPKTIVRADEAFGFGNGAHYALDRQGNRLAATPTGKIISIHFWFTTLSRFTHKAETIHRFETAINKQHRNKEGWKWSRWSKLLAFGEGALAAEFAWQFPPQAQFDELTEQGIIRTAHKYWD